MDNFAQALQKAYQQVPHRIAITLLKSGLPDQDLSYQEILLKASGYTQALEDLDIDVGEVVVLILDHGQDLIAAFFGAILHGAVPAIMPFLTEKLSPERYRASLFSLFGITEPAAVITYPEFVPEVQGAITKASASGQIVPKLISSSKISTHTNIDWQAMRGLSRKLDDLVLLQHSSGTTGLQKGVALSNRAVFNQIAHYSKALHLSDNDVIVSWLPLYHDMGLIAGFVLPIITRTHLVLMSPFDWVRAPFRLMQTVSNYRGTLTWLPNFAYNFCARKIRDKDLKGVDLSSWRAVINCSEPMSWTSHDMFIKRFTPYGLREEALATCYAMAENVFAVTQGGIDTPLKLDIIDKKELSDHHFALPVSGKIKEGDVIKMLSAGSPIDNTYVKVLDKDGVELPERKIGEIALQGDCLLSGYYRRPDLSEKTFTDGWYLTGDLGYLADSELYITGRKKDLIIVGGKNIYPQDIENLAGEVDGVHPGRVAAFGVFNENSGTEDVILIAEVEHDIDQVATNGVYSSGSLEEQIAREIRHRVTKGSDITLRTVVLVWRNWLIKTSSGKVARAANREKYLALFRNSTPVANS